uniref:TPR end-of-group domain-containing protein n=1 Tax=uncultured Dysgonomonas sp. TaxID=206096 RepID=UPI00260D5512|nr:SIR2 family protein [uncultured Dysgonomonas sp.]
MTEGQVEDIADLLKDAKNSKNKPIVFLGAGMSVAGGIPSADKIAEEILSRFRNKPKIKRIKKEDRTYANLMDCLTFDKRYTLLNEYIEKAKINVGYIYLAHLIKEGYIDYVLTVNFDNLILRAMAMYNLFPPTYDLSILNDMTTSNIETQSVTYLHGTHRGLWMLNTQDELNKISKTCSSFLSRITERRTWIVIGYSGEDKLLDEIANLGSFTNDLYWVTYKDNEPSQRVQDKLLNQPNKNAYLIKGYDADLFMLRLHSEVGLPTPDILYKPFTTLQNTINSIVEISDEHKNIKGQLEITKRHVKDAIRLYEEGASRRNYSTKEVNIDLLKKEIIKYTIEESFNENADRIEEIRKELEEINNKKLNEDLAHLYTIWSLKQNTKTAISTMLVAIKLKDDSTNNYWLSFLYNTINDKKNTLKYLKASLSKNYKKTIEDIKNHRDWDSLRDDPDFIALIKEYEEKEEKEKKSK